MTTRQARPSAEIIGFDTHMILEARPCLALKTWNGHQVVNQDMIPLCRGPDVVPTATLCQHIATPRGFNSEKRPLMIL